MVKRRHNYEWNWWACMRIEHGCWLYFCFFFNSLAKMLVNCDWYFSQIFTPTAHASMFYPMTKIGRDHVLTFTCFWPLLHRGYTGFFYYFISPWISTCVCWRRGRKPLCIKKMNCLLQVKSCTCFLSHMECMEEEYEYANKFVKQGVKIR